MQDPLAERGELRGVVAAGGDGTVAEIVNRVPDGVPVTVLPLGTENLLAKYLGIGREVESVGETIAPRASAMPSGRPGTSHQATKPTVNVVKITRPVASVRIARRSPV